VECGSNILSGANLGNILRLVQMVTERKEEWQPPQECPPGEVADTFFCIVLDYRLLDLAEAEWSVGRRI
jgi:hypothetical protein